MVAGQIQTHLVRTTNVHFLLLSIGNLDFRLNGFIIQLSHSIPTANLRLREDQHSDENARQQDQHGLNHVGPDNGFQPAKNRVACRHNRQHDDSQHVMAKSDFRANSHLGSVGPQQHV